MSKSVEVLREAHQELQMLYEIMPEGILVVNTDTRRFVRANRAICKLLGYSQEEMLSLSVADVHPLENLPDVLEMYGALRRGDLSQARNIPFRRKDGSVLDIDVTANHSAYLAQPLMVEFLHDATERNRTIELLHTSEERYRLIAENVADVIWTVPFMMPDAEQLAAGGNVAETVDAILDHWRFSYVSPAVERVFGYTPDEVLQMSLCDMTTPESFGRIRQRLIERFAAGLPDMESDPRQRVLEIELLAKDGSLRWCEAVSTYLCDDDGRLTSVLGITRDISQRRKAESALRESEIRLRNLFENLPDFVIMVDRSATIQFANRGVPGMDRAMLLGTYGFDVLIPEHREAAQLALDRAFATGAPQSVDVLDIFGHCWACRMVAPARDCDDGQATIICTDVTQERLATEALHKEQQLLRQLLELHERERQLTAYEIHDGFAQQLTGALFRLQAFRETHGRNPAEAWKSHDLAVRLIGRAIDETRRLISGLRPPILDESGVVQAIEYLAYEHDRHDGPAIDFTHNVAFERLAPPLESAIFRIVQESLQNACRHSRSDRVRVELTQRGNRIHIDVQDWGVGFSADTVQERRFGLQGIRERVRLLEGRIVIESAPGKGTHIGVELPLVDGASGQAGATKSFSSENITDQGENSWDAC